VSLFANRLVDYFIDKNGTCRLPNVCGYVLIDIETSCFFDPIDIGVLTVIDNEVQSRQRLV
jgi:hypothetical protein